MPRLLALCAAALALTVVTAPVARAECYADYKAKRDAPLRLHYGVIALPDRACGNTAAATRIIERRIARDGWTLLTVLSTFDENGLRARRANAGDFYLRY